MVYASRWAAVLVAGLGLCGSAQAGLIGDTVTYDGVSARITGVGNDISTTYNGVPVAFSFTDDTVTLSSAGYVPLPGGLEGAFNGGTFALSFGSTEPTGLAYVSGHFVPPQPPSPGYNSSGPGGICVCAIFVPPPVDELTDLTTTGHTLSFTLGSAIGDFSPFIETLRVGTAADPLPAPGASAMGLALVGLMAAVGWRSWRAGV